MIRTRMFIRFTVLCSFFALAHAQGGQTAQVAAADTKDQTAVTNKIIAPTVPASQATQAAAAQSAPSEQLALPADVLKKLEATVAEQQRQIEELTSALKEQKQTLDHVLASTNESPAASSPLPKLGEVASTVGMVPNPPPVSLTTPTLAAQKEPQPGEIGPSPLQLRLGSVFITPVGFMDMTAVSRSENTGTGIGTNFGSIPYGNTQTGSLTETRLSIQNSRLGMRIDANVKGAKVMGYWESDFLGQIGTSTNSPNGGLAVTSNPFVFRMRLYWADVRYSKFEILAGQSWSLMTPNRKGLSPIPGDIFYSQDIDVNYQLGLVWSRVPGYRFVFHPSDTVAFGFSLENSEPYIGGGNGGGAAVAPTALAGIIGSQVNNGGSGITAPALFPDVVAKLAFDPSSKLHIEFAGVEIANKISDPATTPAFQTFSKVSGGGSVNLNFELFKGFRLLTNNFWSDGAGRYIFGQAPDFILRANGSISPVHSGSTVSGFEYTSPGRMPTLLYVYYGGVYIGRDTAFDANGTTRIGYGYTGSANSQNRTVQEFTIGTNTTFWKDSKYGALNLMFQYSYLQRNPWFVATGGLSDAHIHMGFVNLRYTLPGSAPTMEQLK